MRPSPSPPEPSHGRVFGLDLMRAAAILAVVYAHGYFLLDGLVDIHGYFRPVPDGVTLFFVLSGFLVGRILLEALADPAPAWQALLRFWTRRWFRTLPAYLLVLVGLGVVSVARGHALPDGFLRYVFFVQNLAWPHPGFFPEAWSLAVEEWFYLLVPVQMFSAVRLAREHPDRAVLAVVALVILAVMALRAFRVLDWDPTTGGDWDALLRKQVATRLDSLMWGVLGAWLSLRRPGAWHRWAAAALAAGLLLFVGEKVVLDHVSAAAGRAYVEHAMLAVQPFAALLLLPALSRWRRFPGFVGRAVTFVSVTSYAAYLLHLTVVQGLAMPAIASLTGLPARGWGAYAGYWALTFGCAWLLHRAWERPMTALRDAGPVVRLVGHERHGST